MKVHVLVQVTVVFLLGGSKQKKRLVPNSRLAMRVGLFSKIHIKILYITLDHFMDH